jgi:hypothetical protein
LLVDRFSWKDTEARPWGWAWLTFGHPIARTGLAGVAVCLLMAASGPEPPPGPVAMVCTNALGRSPWRIMIDYGKSVVDAEPAEISPDAISWFDPTDRATYLLDRRSGNLRSSLASSTGGYFRYGHCSPAKSP